MVDACKKILNKGITARTRPIDKRHSHMSSEVKLMVLASQKPTTWSNHKRQKMLYPVFWIQNNF